MLSFKSRSLGVSFQSRFSCSHLNLDLTTALFLRFGFDHLQTVVVMKSSKNVLLREAAGQPGHLKVEAAARHGGRSGDWCKPLSWLIVNRQRQVYKSHAIAHNTTHLPHTNTGASPFHRGWILRFVGISNPLCACESSERGGKQINYNFKDLHMTHLTSTHDRSVPELRLFWQSLWYLQKLWAG